MVIQVMGADNGTTFVLEVKFTFPFVMGTLCKRIGKSTESVM